MQQVQQRELPERISWARAMIFAIGFFLIAAILLGQLPSYIYIQMTGSTLTSLESSSFSLGVICLACFAVIQVIVLLFDPKPVVPPLAITVVGVILAVVGLALSIWSTTTGCSATNQVCNQFFPVAPTSTSAAAVAAASWHPVLGGQVLWFPANVVDLLMLGLVLLGLGVAMVFYSVLALRELRNPDRRDLGTTPGMRWMIVGSILLLVVFLVFYSYSNDSVLGPQLFPSRPFLGTRLVDLSFGIILGAAIFMALGAFALRLHYLMRPVRKRTMPGLYMVGAIGLASLGAVALLAWLVVYPFIDWLRVVPILGPYFVVCAKPYDVPASCAFSQNAASLVCAVVTGNFFVLLMAAVWAWKSHRNVVIIGSAVTIAVIGLTAFLMHTAPNHPTSDQPLVGMMLCGAILVLAAIWTTVARREFAVVGERNLGCIGQWLVVGTCFFVYVAAFALFSIPAFSDETEPNISFAPGGGLNGLNAMTVLIILGLLAAIQFFFLARNRYKV